MANFDKYRPGEKFGFKRKKKNVRYNCSGGGAINKKYNGNMFASDDFDDLTQKKYREERSRDINYNKIVTKIRRNKKLKIYNFIKKAS